MHLLAFVYIHLFPISLIGYTILLSLIINLDIFISFKHLIRLCLEDQPIGESLGHTTMHRQGSELAIWAFQ